MAVVQGLEPNYLVVAANYEGSDGGAFYTTEATADNAGQIGLNSQIRPEFDDYWVRFQIRLMPSSN